MKIPTPNIPKLKSKRKFSPKAITIAMVLAIAGITTLALSQAATDNSELDESQLETLIVDYKKGSNISALDASIEDVSGREERNLKQSSIKIIKVPKGTRDQAIKELQDDPNVVTVEKDAKVRALAVPNDPSYADQWAWQKLQMPPVWDKTTGDANTIIAVVDSGANINHVELLGQFTAGYNVLDGTTNIQDNFGHGTAVSGIIAAISNNALGMASGCPKCKVMPIKALDAQDGTMSDVLAGYDYAVAHGAKIINLSVGGDIPIEAFQTAINEAAALGVVTVAAAGNDGNSTNVYPAAFNNVIAVGGTAQDETAVPSSSFGSWVDVGAPGTEILSAYFSANDLMAYNAGTSFASPEVTAIVGLMRSKFPTSTPADITDAIITTTDACCSAKFSHGRVNATKAFSKLETKYGDIIKPTISFVTPANNATVSSVVNVTVNASDNVSISRVDFQVSGSPAVVDTTAPYSYSWNTSTVADGSYILNATVYDSANNSATTTRTVTVKNANPTQNKIGDLNKDQVVNLLDLSLLLSNWNTSNAIADLNSNGKVDLLDLSLLLSNWNK